MVLHKLILCISALPVLELQALRISHSGWFRMYGLLYVFLKDCRRRSVRVATTRTLNQTSHALNGGLGFGLGLKGLGIGLGCLACKASCSNS